MDPDDCPEGLLGVFKRSHTSLTLADPARDDQPLIAINQAFCDMIEYAPDAVLGRNCRFLQPPGGAGPVRVRMRRFIAEDAAGEGRFVIANITGGGRQFVNIVYLAKLRHAEGRLLILGSQFTGRGDDGEAAGYERALRSDLTSLSRLVSEGRWMLEGSMQAIANTASLLAQHYLDKDRHP